MKSKRTGVGVLAAVVAAGWIPVRLCALDAAELEALSRSVTSARVPEVPAVIAALVTSAAPKDRTEAATTAVVAAVRLHPAAIGACVLAAVRAAPDSAEPIVVAALDIAPGGALALVSVAAELEDDIGDRVIEVAERRFPNRAASFEREIAVVRTRRLTGVTVPPPAAARP
ncbi:MAG: hypothetical protein JNL10_00270 [Verrucomicrobiales bacterium]|nr:hypothetical protein [Verrucomicrobiales bacterium]